MFKFAPSMLTKSRVTRLIVRESQPILYTFEYPKARMICARLYIDRDSAQWISYLIFNQYIRVVSSNQLGKTSLGDWYHILLYLELNLAFFRRVPLEHSYNTCMVGANVVPSSVDWWVLSPWAPSIRGSCQKLCRYRFREKKNTTHQTNGSQMPTQGQM
jgi:hypothetical protein